MNEQRRSAMARFRKVTLAVPVAGLLLVAAACGSDNSGGSSSATTASPATTTAAATTAAAGGATTTAAGGTSGGAGSLKDVCPATVAVQTDWNPEAEHGHLYQMLGPGYTVNADKKSVTGTLVDSKGNDTGVKLEVRSGGPAIGFQKVTSQMYLDDSITLGYVYTDEGVELSKDQRTVEVFAPFDKNPQMIMWDPATYPNITSIADLGKTDTKILYFGTAAYMEDYLIPTGVVKQSQADGSYQGGPDSFVAAGGKVAQQGFASAEPYIYQNEVKQWGKPVKFQLIHDTGYPIYSQAVSVRADKLSALSPCLKKLVPIMQQATVDYVKNPAKTNAIILELVQKFNNGWQYSQGVADYAVKTMLDLGLVGNGPDKKLGNMEPDRIDKIIKIVGPALAKSGKDIKSGLKPADMSTNEFIDMSIGL
jgi:hypothetical protein